MAQHGHSAACCTIPPVRHDYEVKGTYLTVNGTRVYATGPTSAKKAILLVYDIFGFKPQTLQGADILSQADNPEPSQQYRVFVPDFFDGKPADLSWFPPDTKEKEGLLGNFFQTTGAPPKGVERVPGLVDALNKENGSAFSKWAIVGLCWGGKVAALSTTSGTSFGAAAVAHPAMVDPADAPGITVPFAMLPSADENMDDVRAFEKDLKVPNLIEHYPDQIHGFMGARGDLKDENVAKKYRQGYETVLKFLHDHL